jgi:hypothetical protein
MTSLRDFEERLGGLLHEEALQAGRASDTDHELHRLAGTWERRTTRNRRIGYVAVVAMVALVLAIGLPRTGGGPPPANEVPKVVDLDKVLAPIVKVATPAVPRKALPVALAGTAPVTYFSRDTYDRLVVFTADPGNLTWTLRLRHLDGSALTPRIRFAASGDPLGAADERTAVLAVRNGGPLPAVQDRDNRADGLLRLDIPSGRVLGFSRIPLVSDVTMAPDGTAWAVTPHTVFHLDPRTGRRLGRLPTPGLANRVIFHDDRLWLAYEGATPSIVYAVDPGSGALEASYTTNRRVTLVQLPGGMALVADLTGRIVRIDDDGSVSAVHLDVTELRVARGVAGVDEDIWLNVDDTLLRVDGETLRFTGGVRLPWAGSAGLAREGSRLLVTDPATGAVRALKLSALRTPG